MAINLATLEAAIATKLGDELYAAYSTDDVPPRSAYNEASAIFASAIILVANEIKANADIIGVTAGPATVFGAVN